jgi:hypothetical protein
MEPTMVRRAAALGAVALAMFAAGCARPGAAAVAPPDAAVTADLPARALVEPVDPLNPRTGPAVAEVGRTYPFDLYTHCGIEYAPFGGKTWKAVTPLPEPRAKAGEDGITVYSGYTAGTMTLVDASTARFVADLRYTEVAASVVEFEVSERPAPGCK